MLSDAYCKYVQPVMHKHAESGAYDSEPRSVAKSYLDKVAQAYGFYCLSCLW